MDNTHESMAVGAIEDRLLVHGGKVIPILEDLLGSFLRMDAHDVRSIGPRPLEIVLVQYSIAMKNLANGFGCVKRQQSV